MNLALVAVTLAFVLLIACAVALSIQAAMATYVAGLPL